MTAPTPITVLHLVDHMGMGGLQRSVASYLANYDREKYRLLLVRLQKKETWTQWEDVPEIQSSTLIRVRHSRDTAGIRRLASFMSGQNVRILHSHGPFPNQVARQAALLAGTPVVLAHYHSTYENRFHEEQIAWERLLWPLTSRALMVSDQVRQAWHALTGIAEDRQSVVWVPVDFQAVDRSRDNPTSALLERIASFNPQWPLLTSASRLFKYKWIDDILKAVALLKERQINVRLFVAGDGPERQSLEQMAANLQINDRVLFLGTIDDVPALLARSSASILASTEEGFSQLNIEAMHCGTPVISTCVGVVDAVDPKGEFIYVVGKRSPEEIAGAMERILADPAERMLRIEKAKQATARFDTRQWARNLEDLYDRELREAFLQRSRPWGYGTGMANLRLLSDRVKWRWLRASIRTGTPQPASQPVPN